MQSLLVLCSVLLLLCVSRCGAAPVLDYSFDWNAAPLYPEPVPKLMFGANYNDNENGFGSVYGELLFDRSFRSRVLGAAGSWGDNFSLLGCAVTFVASGGDPHPDNGPIAYPGYGLFTGGGAGETGYVGVLQIPSASLVYYYRAGVPLTIRFSVAFNATGKWSASAPSTSLPHVTMFFLGNGNSDLIDLTYDQIVAQGGSVYTDSNGVVWRRAVAIFTPPANFVGGSAVFSIGANVVSGATPAFGIGFDEIRFFPNSTIYGKAKVDDSFVRAAHSMGVQSMRWPGGNVNDFHWNNSVGPMYWRGEHPITAAGPYETIAFGLDEFLQTCERENWQAVLMVNPFDTPASNARFAEYVWGDPVTTVGGQLRAQYNPQHTQPYAYSLVSWLEVGNEVSSDYAFNKTNPDYGQAGSYYNQLGVATVNAMRAAVPGLTANLRFSCIFDVQDVEDHWNDAVLKPASNSRLATIANFSNVHYYSFQYFDQGFNVFDDSTAFPGIMSGSSLLRYAKQNLDPRSANATRGRGPLPLVTTEYSLVTIHADPSFGLNDARVATFAAGLNIADFLLMMITERFAGAHVFDISQSGPNWGLMGQSAAMGVAAGGGETKWIIRPAGYAFRLMSVCVGDQVLNTQLSNPQDIPVVSFPAAIGIIPQFWQYPTFSLLVSKPVPQPGGVLFRAFGMNRHLTLAQEGTLTVPNIPASRCGGVGGMYRVVITTYASYFINATNDNPGPILNPDPFAVTLTNVTVDTTHPFSFLIGAHTLIRYDITACPPPVSSSAAPRPSSSAAPRPSSSAAPRASSSAAAVAPSAGASSTAAAAGVVSSTAVAPAASTAANSGAAASTAGGGGASATGAAPTSGTTAGPTAGTTAGGETGVAPAASTGGGGGGGGAGASTAISSGAAASASPASLVALAFSVVCAAAIALRL